MAILAAGVTAPGFALPDVEGATRSLEAERARGLAVVAFFSLECRACDLSYVFWDRMHVAYEAAGCPLLAISLEGAEEAARFYDSSGVSFPVLFDPGNEVARAYGVECTPSLFLVDAAGVVLSSHDAFDRDAVNALSTQIAATLDLDAVTLAEGEAPAFSPGCVAHFA